MGGALIAVVATGPISACGTPVSVPRQEDAAGSAGRGAGGLGPASAGGSTTAGVVGWGGEHLGEAAGENGGGGGADTAGRCLDDGQIVITDDTNYSLSSSSTIETVMVKDAENLTFRWHDLDRDYLGRPVEAAEDIDLVTISLWEMTEEELTNRLDHDTLTLGATKLALTFYPEDADSPPPTEAQLLDFSLLGNPLPEEQIWRRFDTSTQDYEFPQDTHTFMITAGTGRSLGQNMRMLTFFELDPEATGTTITLHDDSCTIENEVSLANAPRLSVPAADPHLTIDWSSMSVTAIGNPYDVDGVDEVVVAHFADSTLTELEEAFPFFPEDATEWYSGNVDSQSAFELGTLEDETGTSFPGIDGRGVWLVALFCSYCFHPAPWSITVLQACG